nr:zinc finger, CCHC-type [Tanacetum cinerariifolium]
MTTSIILSIEDKLNYLEQLIPPALVALEGQQVSPEILAAHTAWIKGSKEIAGLMLMTMEPEIQQNLENLHAHEMLLELKTLFAQQAEQELLQTTRDFHSCKQEEGQSEFDGFVQNYNMHSLGKIINELHAMLKLHEQTLPKNNAPAPHAIRAGHWKRNCPQYLSDLLKKKKLSQGASNLGSKDGFINRFMNNTIQVSRNNMIYFSAIPMDGIFEIDLSNSYANDSSMYAISNKRAKLDLDSALLWHCRLEHISKKRIKKLQHDGLLNSTDLRDFEKYKWLFKKKTDMDGAVHTYKAHLMAKGYTQTLRINYEETFSHVTDIRAIRMLIAITAFYDYEIWQMAIKTAFLNGYLSEEVYIEQPEEHNKPISTESRVSCYTDVGYLTDANDLKSQIGYVFILYGGVVDWKSAKQSIFATSSAEAEYIAVFDASKEAVWVRKFIYGLGVVPIIEEPISMYYDNTRAITIANESGFTKGARHFCVKVHYLREFTEYGDVKLEKVHTDDYLADPFTKALAFLKHSEHTRNIGMLPACSLNINF